MRCFVAAFLTPASAVELHSAFRAVYPEDESALPQARMRRVPLDNYHVTLKFIGEAAEADLPALLGAVADLPGGNDRTGTIVTEMRRFVGFPRPAAARMAVGELPPDLRLQTWASELEAALGASDRAFRPHVTVARFRRPVAFPVTELDRPLCLELQLPALYRSEQTGSGVRYRRVTAAP
ncbi:MAG: 2'-5' RNA ligase family protein [Gammaproteobacteria bacterium]|nr:2'-5' RNA ligase family protein [Gammaproteobacteria bacterium]